MVQGEARFMRTLLPVLRSGASQASGPKEELGTQKKEMDKVLIRDGDLTRIKQCSFSA